MTVANIIKRELMPIPGMKVKSIVNRPLIYLIVWSAVLSWLAIAAPTPEFFLIGADGGHQLAGAMQLLEVGEHPYVDYFETYGPLTFYCSALAQFLTGGRPGGEIGLVILGWSLGYLLMFRLLLLITKTIWPSLAILALALILLPQFYKYYCVLLPFISLTAAHYYIERPGRLALGCLACSVAVAGLFRHDFGVFTVIMAMVTVFSDQAVSWRNRFLSGSWLLGLSVVFCLPWFLFLLWHQALERYFAMIFYASAAMSQGLMLPHPLLHWQAPFLSLGYLVFSLLPFIAAWLLWRNGSGQPTSLVRLQLAGCVLAAVSMVQASHRADFFHLMEGIPPAFLCMATIGHFCRGATVWLLLAVLGIAWQGAPYSLVSNLRPLQFSRKISYFSLTRRQYVDHLVQENPKFWPAQLVQSIRDQTNPGERVAIYPFFMKFNYFAERPFAAGMMLLASGYFDSDRYLQEAIRRLHEQKVRYVLWNEQFCFDGVKARNPIISSALLHEAIQKDYERIGRTYGFTVFAKKGM